MDMWAVEAFGYVASALVVASFAMASVVRLRLVSLAGSVTFVVYGLLLPSIPIIVTNLAVAAVNLWQLRKEFGADRDLGVVPIATDAPFLADFLRAFHDDIQHYEPDFALADDASAWLLTRQGLPAGVFVGRRDGATMQADLDYVTPAYRDSRLGSWLYSTGADFLRDGGITRVVARPETPVHRSYLAHMGFESDGDVMVRSLA